MKKYALYLLVIVGIVIGCNGDKDYLSSTWCLLLDMSGVRENPETRQQYSENFSRIFEQINPGDALIVAMITESSINESDFVENVEFSSFHPTTDNELYKKSEQQKFDTLFSSEKQEVRQRIQNFIVNNDRITPTTDIISAIHLAGNVFKKYGNSSQYLVILSDMEQYSSDYKFPSENLNEERINQIIEIENQKSRGIPDLTGVKVYVAGAKSKDSDRFFRIRNFWLVYFDACNATLMSEDYGAALIEL